MDPNTQDSSQMPNTEIDHFELTNLIKIDRDILRKGSIPDFAREAARIIPLILFVFKKIFPDYEYYPNIINHHTENVPKMSSVTEEDVVDKIAETIKKNGFSKEGWDITNRWMKKEFSQYHDLCRQYCESYFLSFNNHALTDEDTQVWLFMYISGCKITLIGRPEIMQRRNDIIKNSNIYINKIIDAEIQNYQFSFPIVDLSKKKHPQLPKECDNIYKYYYDYYVNIYNPIYKQYGFIHDDQSSVTSSVTSDTTNSLNSVAIPVNSLDMSNTSITPLCPSSPYNPEPSTSSFNEVPPSTCITSSPLDNLLINSQINAINSLNTRISTDIHLGTEDITGKTKEASEVSSNIVDPSNNYIDDAKYMTPPPLFEETSGNTPSIDKPLQEESIRVHELIPLNDVTKEDLQNNDLLLNATFYAGMNTFHTSRAYGSSSDTRACPNSTIDLISYRSTKDTSTTEYNDTNDMNSTERTQDESIDTNNNTTDTIGIIVNKPPDSMEQYYNQHIDPVPLNTSIPNIALMPIYNEKHMNVINHDNDSFNIKSTCASEISISSSPPPHPNYYSSVTTFMENVSPYSSPPPVFPSYDIKQNILPDPYYLDNTNISSF
ncbi:hypothetical protein WA158_007808 [Blastocystis sp. Blastoise]